jgi:hypothetical protein
VRDVLPHLAVAARRPVGEAAILGIEGDEAIHAILNLMYARARYPVLLRSMPIHPTVSELLPTLLERLEPVAEPIG